MFTGLIESVGLVKALAPRGNYQILTVSSSLPSKEISIGESIACNGACLTVVEKQEGSFTVELSQETAEKTAMSRFQNGAKLNLERALRVGDRLGGHFVSGHVDCTGTVDQVRKIGESWEIAVAFDEAFDAFVIDKGSIAIDGVSLTVNETRDGWLSVNVIPHTIGETNLGDLKSGDPVNIEFDLIGKYIMKIKNVGQPAGLTIDTLLESGW
jgi:riboflavin synthase